MMFYRLIPLSYTFILLLFYLTCSLSIAGAEKAEQAHASTPSPTRFMSPFFASEDQCAWQVDVSPMIDKKTQTPINATSRLEYLKLACCSALLTCCNGVCMCCDRICTYCCCCCQQSKKS